MSVTNIYLSSICLLLIDVYFLGVPLKNILRKLQVKKKKLSTKKKLISIQDYTFLDKQKKNQTTID